MWLIVVMFATMRRGVDGISVFGDRWADWRRFPFSLFGAIASMNGMDFCCCYLFEAQFQLFYYIYIFWKAPSCHFLFGYNSHWQSCHVASEDRNLLAFFFSQPVTDEWKRRLASKWFIFVYYCMWMCWMSVNDHTKYSRSMYCTCTMHMASMPYWHRWLTCASKENVTPRQRDATTEWTYVISMPLLSVESMQTERSSVFISSSFWTLSISNAQWQGSILRSVHMWIEAPKHVCFENICRFFVICLSLVWMKCHVHKTTHTQHGIKTRSRQQRPTVICIVCICIYALIIAMWPKLNETETQNRQQNWILVSHSVCPMPMCVVYAFVRTLACVFPLCVNFIIVTHTTTTKMLKIWTFICMKRTLGMLHESINKSLFACAPGCENFKRQIYARIGFFFFFICARRSFRA